MSTYNICFYGDIRYISVFFFVVEKSILAGAMYLR